MKKEILSEKGVAFLIALYLTKTEYLPSREILLGRVLLKVDADKADQWRHGSEKRALESLSGVLLLQYGLEQAGISCAGARLRYEAMGRPFLETLGVDFSISHVDGITACAVMWGEEGRLGVDLERVQGRSMTSMQRIAERWFAEGERAMWREHSDELQFLQIWTGKEALSKQRGCGLGELIACDVTQSGESRLWGYSREDLVVTLCSPSHVAVPEEPNWITL